MFRFAMAQTLRTAFGTVRQDFLAATVIFLLGIPLSMGAALASGAPPQSGLIAGALGGLVCGILCGAPMLVTGPVVALAVMTIGVIERYGFAAMCAVTLAAGVLQIIFGALRLGRLVLAVNTAILEGMLASVGVSLVISQTRVITQARSLGNVWLNFKTLPVALAHAPWRAALTALATMAVVVLWGRLPWRRYIPGPLVAIVAVSTFAWYFDVSGLRRVALPTSGLWSVLEVESLRGLFADPGRALTLGLAAVQLALVCSMYSLLSAVAVDKLHTGRRANLDQELMAQGTANLACGLLGGLPVSGAVLRSSANIAAGAKTRAALLIQGLLMILALTQLGFILRHIPVACLAAFFVLLGISLVRPSRMAYFFRQGTLSLYIAALLGGLACNLLVGVLLGVGLNLVYLCCTVLSLKVTVHRQDNGCEVALEGVASFLGVAKLMRTLSRLPPRSNVVIVNRTTYTDATVSAALVRFCEAHTQLGGHAVCEGDGR